MKRKDFDTAKAQLSRCREIVEKIEQAGSAQEMVHLWSDFLVSSQRVFSKLAAAATIGRSAGWFGTITKQRKDDELLQYVHQARHADEHGLENIAEARPNRLTANPIDRSKPLTMKRLTIGRSGIQIEGAQNADINFTPADAILQPVKNKSRVYPPPSTHLGKP